MANSARIDELQRRFAENPRRYFAPLANEYRKNGNLEQAILICQEYLPQQPGHMSGHIVYGQTLYEAGRFAEARAVFETALSLDPENLIALHHLGDIARELGDVETARSWYRRVLETDPRNDEIIQLLAQLESVAPSTASVADGTVSSAVAADTPNVAEYEPTSVPPIPTPPVNAAELLGFEPTSVHSIDESETVVEESSEDAAVSAEGPSAAAGDEPDPFELVAVDSRPEEVTVDDSISVYEPQPTSWMEPPAESSPEEEIALASGGVEGRSDTSTAEALDAELFGDEDEVSHEPEGVTAVAQSAGDAYPVSADDIEREGDIFEANARSTDVASFADAATAAEEVIDEPPVEPVLASSVESETSPIDGGHDGRESPPAPEDAFVTETMADLYLGQGHLESALDIFRRLVAQRPGDERIRERLRAVEDRLFGATVEIETPTVSRGSESSQATSVADAAEQAVDESSATPSDSVAAYVETPKEGPVADVEPAPASSSAVVAAPSIREFLTGILARRTAAPVAPAPEAEAADASDRPASAPESIRDVPISPVVSMDAVDVEATASEAADQPLNQLSETPFDEPSEPDANVTAATVLAEAFSDGEAPSAPLEGVPAHRAPNELSLDHVFRTPNKGVESAAFSFDRFFSDETKEKKPASAPEPQENPTGALDDIAQFNEWLNGLKKS